MALDLSGITSRTYQGDEDLPALVDLINEVGQAAGETRLIKAENIKQFLGSPRVEKPQLWENSAGQLLMNVTLMPVFIEDGEDRSLEVRTLLNVHPEARGQGLEDRVIDWCVEQARELGKKHNLPTTLGIRLEEKQTWLKEIVERHGFEVTRYYFTMEYRANEPLPEPQLPEGFVVRDRAGIIDPQAWADLYNQSFIDHYHHHHMSVAAVEHENKNPDYRPDLDLVVIGNNDTWAALCYTHINPGETAKGEQIGWIGLLGTRRGYRNRGIGTATLLTGMHLLQKESCPRIRLHVDGGSLTGATRLYEAVGFRSIETALHYNLPIV